MVQILCEAAFNQILLIHRKLLCHGCGLLKETADQEVPYGGITVHTPDSNVIVNTGLVPFVRDTPGRTPAKDKQLFMARQPQR